MNNSIKLIYGDSGQVFSLMIDGEKVSFPINHLNIEITPLGSILTLKTLAKSLDIEIDSPIEVITEKKLLEYER